MKSIDPDLLTTTASGALRPPAPPPVPPAEGAPEPRRARPKSPYLVKLRRARPTTPQKVGGVAWWLRSEGQSCVEVGEKQRVLEKWAGGMSN